MKPKKDLRAPLSAGGLEVPGEKGNRCLLSREWPLAEVRKEKGPPTQSCLVLDPAKNLHKLRKGFSPRTFR